MDLSRNRAATICCGGEIREKGRGRPAGPADRAARRLLQRPAHVLLHPVREGQVLLPLPLAEAGETDLAVVLQSRPGIAEQRMGGGEKGDVQPLGRARGVLVLLALIHLNEVPGGELLEQQGQRDAGHSGEVGQLLPADHLPHTLQAQQQPHFRHGQAV